MLLLKAAGIVTAAAWEATSVNVGPANFALNMVAIFMLIVVGLRAGRGRLKDETIKDLRDSLEAAHHRERDLQKQAEDYHRSVRQIEQGASHLKEENAALEARYEEQSQYTAKNALEFVSSLIEKMDLGQERRHKEIMRALEALTTALGK